MLSIENVHFSYGEVKTLHGISLQAEPGKITCITGRNGVGKTTLLKCIMGLLPFKQGTLTFQNKDLTRLEAYQRSRQGIALVPQGRHIFPRMTVLENLQVGLEANPQKTTKIPDEVYELFPVLHQMRNRMGGDLSGGQQQQLALGRALAGNPKVLLLDEPTEGIQPNIIQQIGDVLCQLSHQKGIAVVLVEQYLDFIKEIGHRFSIMNRGQIVAQGTMQELSDDLINEHLNV